MPLLTVCLGSFPNLITPWLWNWYNLSYRENNLPPHLLTEWQDDKSFTMCVLFKQVEKIENDGHLFHSKSMCAMRRWKIMPLLTVCLGSFPNLIAPWLWNWYNLSYRENNLPPHLLTEWQDDKSFTMCVLFKQVEKIENDGHLFHSNSMCAMRRWNNRSFPTQLFRVLKRRENVTSEM